MTSYAMKRCIHCFEIYECLRSGEGFPEYGNHSNTDYCSACFKVIRKALKSVPKKYERVSLQTKDVDLFKGITLKDVERWEKIENEVPRLCRLVAFPLFDLKNPENQNHARYVVAQDGVHKGIRFRVSTWTVRTDWDEIWVEMEREIGTGRLVGVWKEYR